MIKEEDIKNILINEGLDPLINIAFKTYNVDFEGICIMPPEISPQGSKSIMDRANLQIIIRFYDDYIKARQIGNQIKKILREGNLIHLDYSDYRIVHFYLRNYIPLGKTENGYEMISINATADYINKF